MWFFKFVIYNNACSKHLLHNKFSKRIYPGTIHPLSKSTRTESQSLMPHRDTSVAFKQAIYMSIPKDGGDPTWLHINTGFQCFNVTQGHKSIYTTSYISIPNDGEDPICISKQGFRLAINNRGINPKLKGMTDLVLYQRRVSVFQCHTRGHKVRGFFLSHGSN